MSFAAIPFKLEAHGGLSQADGIAKISAAGIILEFETKIFGIVNTGVKEVRLPLEEILDVQFKKGFLKAGAKIEIRMQSFLKLSEVPNKDGKVILKIPRDQFNQAREAVETLRKDLSDYNASLPPPRTPVRSLFDGENSETNDLQEPQ